MILYHVDNILFHLLMISSLQNRVVIVENRSYTYSIDFYIVIE